MGTKPAARSWASGFYERLWPGLARGSSQRVSGSGAEQRRSWTGALSRGAWSCRGIMEPGHRERVPADDSMGATATERPTAAPRQFAPQPLPPKAAPDQPGVRDALDPEGSIFCRTRAPCLRGERCRDRFGGPPPLAAAALPHPPRSPSGRRPWTPLGTLSPEGGRVGARGGVWCAEGGARWRQSDFGQRVTLVCAWTVWLGYGRRHGDVVSKDFSSTQPQCASLLGRS